MVKRMDDLDKILRLALYSGFLAGERPLNLLIIGFPGTGKTELLSQYMHFPGVLYNTYISFPRLLNHYGSDIISGKIHHILMPDFAVQAGRSKDTVKGELAAFGSLIEEGILQWETSRTVFKAHLVRRVGIIACTTDETLSQVREVAPPGFLSRFLRVSYSYSEESLREIRSSIARLEYRKNSKRMFKNLKRVQVEGDDELFDRLERSNLPDRVKTGGDTYALRTQIQLQTLVMAHALISGRTKVTQDDLYAIAELASFFNEKYRPL